MDDPVLHRKMFRNKALRQGVLKPRHYQYGTGMEGISTGDPRYESPAKTFVKGNIKYTVSPTGTILATERINVPQIEYKPSFGTRMGNKFFNVAERLFDPEGYKKNIADVKKFGQYMTSSEPYKKGAKAVGKGIKSIGKYSVGYAGASAVGDMTGTSKVVEPALMTTGIAQLAQGLGAGKIPLAGRAINLAAGPGRFLTSPYGIAAGTIAAVPYGMYKLDQYLRKPKEVIDPVTGEKKLEKSAYTKQVEFAEANKDIFDPMSPDDYMMNFDIAQRAKEQDQMKSTGTPMPGSDLQTKGEIPSGQTDQGQGAGGAPTTPGGTGTPTPSAEGQVIPTGGKEKIGKTEVTTNINADLNKKTEELDKKGKVKNPAEADKIGMFDRLQAFAQTVPGNMFMLKFAAGLLSGKGGFGEVVGNALNPAVDTLAAYKLKEQEFANKLFIEQLKSMREKNKNLQVNVGSYPVQNEDGSVSYVQAYQNDKTKTVTYFQDGKQFTAPADQAGLFAQKKAEIGTQQIKLIAKLGDNSGASAIITDLLLQDPQTLGTSGAVKLFGTRLASVAGAVSDVGKKVSYKDIVDTRTGKVVSGDEAAKMKGLEKEVDKNINAIFGQMDNKTRDVLAANGVRAETLKYFLANAFKSEDRLTNRDLEFIGKITNVLAFTKGGDLIQSELKEIQGYLDTKRKTFVKQLHASGYTDLDIATNIFGTSGGAIAASIYGTKKNIPDYGKMLPGEINKQLLEQGIK